MYCCELSQSLYPNGELKDFVPAILDLNNRGENVNNICPSREMRSRVMSHHLIGRLTFQWYYSTMMVSHVRIRELHPHLQNKSCVCGC